MPGNEIRMKLTDSNELAVDHMMARGRHPGKTPVARCKSWQKVL